MCGVCWCVRMCGRGGHVRVAMRLWMPARRLRRQTALLSGLEKLSPQASLGRSRRTGWRPRRHRARHLASLPRIWTIRGLMPSCTESSCSLKMLQATQLRKRRRRAIRLCHSVVTFSPAALRLWALNPPTGGAAPPRQRMPASCCRKALIVHPTQRTPGACMAAQRWISFGMQT